MAMKQNQILIVGCGPGSLDYLTPAGRRAIEEAEVIAGTPHLLEAVAPFAGRACTNSVATKIPVNGNISAALDELAQHQTRKLIVLVTGDPGLCSLAKPVIARFGRAACRIIPGISSVQAAFAAIGVDWLDAHILSAHQAVPDLDVASLKTHPKIAILAGSPGFSEWLMSASKALAADYQLFICSNLTLPNETIRAIAHAELPKTAIPARSIVILIRSELL